MSFFPPPEDVPFAAGAHVESLVRFGTRMADNTIDTLLMFSRASRQTRVHGLADEGQRQDSRHRHTDFGSGWRGLFKVPEKYAAAVFGHGRVAGRAMGKAELAAAAQGVKLNLSAIFDPQARTLIKELRAAEKYTTETGFHATAINSAVPAEQIRQVIRHERLHGVWARYEGHPVLTKLADVAPPLEQNLVKTGVQDQAGALKSIQKMGLETEERFTYGYESSRQIMPTLRQHGLELPQLINRSMLRASQGSSLAPGLARPVTSTAGARKMSSAI